MIISPGRRYIFVHIPKTGGTSMALALEDRAKADDILIGDTPKAKRRKGRLKGIETAGRLWKHSTLAEAEGLITRDQMEDFFTFTLVRNPWDRAVSYYHWLQNQTFQHDAVLLAQSLGFSSFLNHPHTQASLRNWPYARYMTDGAGRVHADLYLRLEQLEDDLAMLNDHLGFALTLPRANASQRPRDWRGFYTEADAELLFDLCAADIAAHGYGFDPT